MEVSKHSPRLDQVCSDLCLFLLFVVTSRPDVQSYSGGILSHIQDVYAMLPHA